MSKAWELGPEDKRGTFVVRTYRPNYLLPVHYTSSQRIPRSPTQAAPSSYDDYMYLEAKFQISLRTKALEDFALSGADLWLAYTQQSLWQIYDHKDSRSFRSNDYQPEATFIVPMDQLPFSRLPFGWRWRMAQFGFAHQSNGESDPLSRSWNRVYLGAGFERESVGLQLRVHRRVFRSGSDDNPDLTRYVGDGEMLATYVTGATIAALTWKAALRSPARGSLQLDWTYPFRRDRPDGLRWYVQIFTGYGETLLDYNHRQTSVGGGVSLFQF